MKKWIAAALISLALLLVLPFACAQEAAEITGKCTFKTSGSKFKFTQMTDGKYTTYWYTYKAHHPYLTISAPAGSPIYSVYCCFREIPDAYEVQVANGEVWKTVAVGDPAYGHIVFDIPGGANAVRILVTGDAKQVLGFNEINIFSKGDLPAWVQRWEAPLTDAEILFFSTHPDDELIFFGGGIPTAVDQGRRVAVAYLTYSNTTRRSELLNGLWALGVRNYPYIGNFRDSFQKTVESQYKSLGGAAKVDEWVASVFRRAHPQVVVTQSADGEYGHRMHQVLVDSVRRVYDSVAPDWQIQKLYLHLWPENASVFDWNVPLASFGGKTGLQLADEAYTTYHITQRTSGMSVSETGREYDNTRFGLCRTEVGPDEIGGDFFEHLDGGVSEAPFEETPVEATPVAEAAVEETPVPEAASVFVLTPEPAAEPESAPEPAAEPAAETGTWVETDPDLAGILPALTGKGFLPEGEFIHADEEAGLYIYINRTLKIVIKRTYEVPDARHPFYRFTADIWCDVERGELPRTMFSDPAAPRRNPAFISEIASNQQLVFATSTDYYNYRAGQKKSRPKSYHVGIEVRNGEIFWDDPNPKPPSMPNYETLAFYRDGHLESLLSTERPAQDYIDGGAYDVYCFGPCLVRDGKLTDYVATANTSYNPRYAFGVVEPGHYVAMLCEGRVKRSKGVQMAYLAQLLLDHGCQLAVNLDGGQTAVFAFMGKQLNQVVKSDPYGRKQIECLAFGTSAQVGTYEWK